MFFTTLILHFGSVMTIRNGVNMCMYVTYHSDNFESPSVAFFLGFMTIFANAFASTTNLLMALAQKNVISVITKFVGFKILIQIQDYYLRSRDQFKIKKAVSNDLEVVINKDKVTNKCHHRIFKVLRVLYTSLYFYFFPLLIIVVPMGTILTIQRKDDLSDAF